MEYIFEQFFNKKLNILKYKSLLVSVNGVSAFVIVAVAVFVIDISVLIFLKSRHTYRFTKTATFFAVFYRIQVPMYPPFSSPGILDDKELFIPTCHY